MAPNTLRADKWSLSDIWGTLAGTSIDSWILLLMLAGFNLHLLGLPIENIPVFLPSAVIGGQWWRIVSHPFVHVSWYHLLLDAGAFFLLYSELKTARMHERLMAFILSAGSSLLTAIWFASQIDAIGLCGLSGAAHGLMALTGLEMMRPRRNPREKQFVLGLVTFLAVSVKSLIEFFNGEVVFAFLHMGLCGTPLAACHLGGVIGGIAAYFWLTWLQKWIRSGDLR